MKLYPIGADDMIEALALLKPRNEDTRRAIAAVLGFDLADIDLPEPDEPDLGPSPKTKPPPDPRPDATPVATEERKFTLVPQQAHSWSVAAQPSSSVGVVPLAQGKAEDTLPRPAFEPLLRRAGERAIVSTLLRVRRRTGPPLLADLIEAAARMKQLSNLPASWQATVGGVDVLLDVGDNMQLFRRDQEWLLSLIRRVVGEGRVTLFSFSGSPARGVMSETDMAFVPYAPPRTGWPVLILTDMGIGARTSGHEVVPLSEWRDFAKRIRTSQCHLIALVPYPRRRWPKVAGIDIVQWDRSTSVGNVRSVIGRLSGA